MEKTAEKSKRELNRDSLIIGIILAFVIQGLYDVVKSIFASLPSVAPPAITAIFAPLLAMSFLFFVIVGVWGKKIRILGKSLALLVAGFLMLFVPILISVVLGGAYMLEVDILVAAGLVMAILGLLGAVLKAAD